MADSTEAEVVAGLAYEAQKPEVLEPGKHYAWITPEGEIVERDLTDELPVFKTGTVRVANVDAFAWYFDKHASDGSEIFADLDKGSITAVLDAHEKDGPRWQKHRLILNLQSTQAWVTWVGSNRTLMKQLDFAEFLEDNIRDLAPAHQQPKGADDRPVIDPAGLLELAQHFQATLKADFSGGTRLQSGQVQLSYVETVTGGSRDKTVDVPSEFAVAITPFEDCEPAVITARFRYRVQQIGVSFMYVLDNPDRRAREAVDEIVAAASSKTGRPIILGHPS